MPALPAVPLVDEGVDVARRELHASEVPWQTVVWNDPVNLMSYVAWVFRRHFGMDAPSAEQRMLQVHHDGRAVVSTGTRERMEADVHAMHGFGLWATMQRSGAA